MKRFTTISFLCMLGLLACTSQKDSNKETQEAVHTATTQKVVIENMQFNPGQVTLMPGDTVLFINKDIVAHNVTEENKAWASPNLPANQEFKIKVDTSFNYFCSLHPVMKGKVIVEN
ncbi:MAG: cupredoxin domain-containing protein [Sphingobacteriales bacterium]|nr:cupredoxin domain-containing protein [Sphingobacteriales bacterium]